MVGNYFLNKAHRQMIGSEIFLKNIDEESAILLQKHAIKKSFPKYELLFSCDDKINYCYFIVDGWIELYRTTFSGEEVVIDVLTKGNIFGEDANFKDNKYHYSAKTITNANLILYPLNIFEKCINNDHILASNIIKISNQKQHKQIDEIEHLICQSAPQKIGCFLLRLSNSKKKNDVIIDFPYDKYLIAGKLGMKAETFSRALTKLAKDTGIKVEGSKIHVSNLDSLINYTCDHCSKYFPCDFEEEIA